MSLHPIMQEIVAAHGAPNKWEHRGWSIAAGRWPEPAYTAVSPNYDASYEGPEDGWVSNGEAVSADSYAGVIEAINDWFQENGA